MQDMSEHNLASNEASGRLRSSNASSSSKVASVVSADDDDHKMATDASVESSSSPSIEKPKSVLPFRQTLIDEARYDDFHILQRRPERICLQAHRSSTSVPLGISLICQEAETVAIGQVLSAGLFAIDNPALEQLEHKMLLQEGDLLESINDFDCRATSIEEIDAYIQELVGVVTLVVSTPHNSEDEGGLCQTVVFKPEDDNVELPLAVGSILLNHNKQDLLQIKQVAPSCNLPLSEGDLVVAMNSSICISLDPLDAQLYVDAKLATSNMLSLTTISSTMAQKRWQQIRKSAVAVGGGTMVGVGAVIMVTPLHPIGHALAIGGVGVLGSEFEAPKRAMRSVKESVTSSIARRKRLNAMESMGDTEPSSPHEEERPSANNTRMQSMRESVANAVSRRKRLSAMEGMSDRQVTSNCTDEQPVEPP